MKCPQDKGHNALFMDGDTHYCAGCGRFTKQQDTARHGFWLRRLCTPVGHFNKKLVKGHEMRMLEGIWYCTKCGRRGQELREQCDGLDEGPVYQDPAQGRPGEDIECGQCAEIAQADEQSHGGEDVLRQGPSGGHIFWRSLSVSSKPAPTWARGKLLGKEKK